MDAGAVGLGPKNVQAYKAATVWCSSPFKIGIDSRYVLDSVSYSDWMVRALM
jgi:hypothetical protein